MKSLTPGGPSPVEMVFQRDGKIIVFIYKQLINFFGFSPFSGAGVADSKIVVGKVERCTVGNGPLVCGNGFVVLLQLQKDIAEIIISQGVVRGKGMIFREVDKRIAVVPLIETGGSQCLETFLKSGIDGERLPVSRRLHRQVQQKRLSLSAGSLRGGVL